MRMDIDTKDLIYLKKVVGRSAWRALRERGAFLKIWRNSTPHNWWVEGKRGKMYWHSDSSGPKQYERPPLRFFTPIEESKEKVVNYSLLGRRGRDCGQPCSTTYVLKAGV